MTERVMLLVNGGLLGWCEVENMPVEFAVPAVQTDRQPFTMYFRRDDNSEDGVAIRALVDGKEFPIYRCDAPVAASEIRELEFPERPVAPHIFRWNNIRRIAGEVPSFVTK